MEKKRKKRSMTAAQMARKRWASVPKEERSALMRAAVNARWKKVKGTP